MIVRSTASIGLVLVAAAAIAPASAEELIPDLPIQCPNCVAWNTPLEPFRIYGDTYYVGTAQLTSILIASDDGHILLDGALPQSAPLIAANIEALGFSLDDVRLIVNSHAHYDHAGGIAALARASRAEVAASASGAAALRAGAPTDDDPQAALAEGFPAVPDVRGVADGETLRIGDLALTARLTPGHTPGSTTWTWRSCEGERCLDMVYADSLSAVSADGFRFTGDAQRPRIVESFRASIALVAALPCDVLMSPHPRVFRMEEKLAARAADPSTNPFIDPNACAAYAAAAAEGLDARVAQEEGGDAAR